MMYWMIGIVVILSAVEWYSEIVGNKTLMYFVKPAAMVVLIAWVILNVNAHEINAPQITWFIIGLCLCLVGDVFLMLPPERGFLPGRCGARLSAGSAPRARKCTRGSRSGCRRVPG